MKKDWFEMQDIRKRKLANAVWIPLRAVHHYAKQGKYGYAGYLDDFYGVGTLAVPVDKKADAERLGWMDVGISHNHSGYVENDEYIPADVYRDYRGAFTGIHVILDQRGNSVENNEWHLHQDLVTTLGLKREGDIWVRPGEDYIQVARLNRSSDGGPSLLEIRAAHLRDYLCARGLALYVTSYRDRSEIVEDATHVTWSEGTIKEEKDRDRWEGRVIAIHEGGELFGAEWAVFHAARTDIDPEEDVPVMGLPTDGNIASNRWTTKNKAPRLYRVMGELWRTEWVDPGTLSPIVRGDRVAPTAFFIVDAEGRKESRETLAESSRWLWFRPAVICTLAERRGGSLKWYTRDTGRIAGSPGSGVHFGVNGLGLINVYAKDIALLEDWEQVVWAGFNVSPDGKLSQELHASQVKADPAATQAPEAFLREGLGLIQELAQQKLGISLIRKHDDVPNLLTRTHRFRA